MKLTVRLMYVEVAMKKKTLTLITLSLLLLLVLSGCMPGDGRYVDNHTANFLSGVWHGWIAPLSLIFGFFNKSIRVYEPYNTGWWYDFGFYIAIISGFGGLSLSRKKKKKDK